MRDIRLLGEEDAIRHQRMLEVALYHAKGRLAMYAVRLPDGTVATALGWTRDTGDIVPLAIIPCDEAWQDIPHLTQEDAKPFQGDGFSG